MSQRRRRQAAPMSAAGLISFYEEYEGKIKLSPTAVIGVALVFSALIVAAHLFIGLPAG